jgi:D-ornithine 4,5-aminomutase subunit alpha
VTGKSFEERRKHLAHLSDEELHQTFWELADKIVDPLVEAGRNYTTPAIERSVLLRMGFSSLEAQAIVNGMIEHGLMSHGAGHLVWRLADQEGAEIRETGLALAQGRKWKEAKALFGEVAS